MHIICVWTDCMEFSFQNYRCLNFSWYILHAIDISIEAIHNASIWKSYWILRISRIQCIRVNNNNVLIWHNERNVWHFMNMFRLVWSVLSNNHWCMKYVLYIHIVSHYAIRILLPWVEEMLALMTWLLHLPETTTKYYLWHRSFQA